MPLPLPGDGDIVGTIGQVIPIGTIYLAAYNPTTPLAAPTAALGSGEPAGGYVKVGCLKDDTFNVTDSDPSVVEYRRGFRQRYYGEVVNKAGQKEIAADIVEPDVAIIAALMGDTTTAVTGGHSLYVESSHLVDKTLLIVYQEAQSGVEFQMYNPHVRVRYKFAKDAQFMILNLMIKCITFKVSNEYKDMLISQFG